MDNPSSIYFGGANVELHCLENSHLGFSHWHRPNAATAWGECCRINTSTGYVTFYKGYGSSSDRSLKGSIQDASTEDALHLLRTVSAKTYTRLDLPGDETSRLGFIANDIEGACSPLWGNLVTKEQYKWSQAPNGAEIRVLDYSRLTAVLWTCTKSLIARVEMLEERIAQLSA